MKDVLSNLTTGTVNKINLAVAGFGPLSALTLEEKARIFAALATGAWFCVQIVFAILDRHAKRRRK